MTRKSLLWFLYAYKQFPDTPFVCKSDDDAFLKVPQLLYDARRLDAERTHNILSKRPMGVYWGLMKTWKGGHWFASGMFYGVDRQAARGIVDAVRPSAGTVLPLLLALTPFDRDAQSTYTTLLMHHEDVLFGRLVRESQLDRRVDEEQRAQLARTHGVPASHLGLTAEGRTTRPLHVLHHMEWICRFHDLHRGVNVHTWTPASAVIHRVQPDGFATLMREVYEGGGGGAAAPPPLPPGRVFRVPYSAFDAMDKMAQGRMVMCQAMGNQSMWAPVSSTDP